MTFEFIDNGESLVTDGPVTWHLATVEVYAFGDHIGRIFGRTQRGGQCVGMRTTWTARRRSKDLPEVYRSKTQAAWALLEEATS